MPDSAAPMAAATDAAAAGGPAGMEAGHELAGGSNESRAAALAREFEARLWKSELDDLGKAAEYIQNELSDDRPEDYGTLTEYRLFARHKKSGLPLLAHMGYRNDGFCDYFGDEGSRERIGPYSEHVGALLKTVCAYVEENPDLGMTSSCARFPATAFLLLIEHSLLVPPKRIKYRLRALPDLLQHVKVAWKRCGALLAPADTPDHFGESQLAAVLALLASLMWPTWYNSNAASIADAGTRLLEAFLEHVPRGARDAINMPSPLDGGTPAHHAVKLGLPAGMLRALIDHGADISIKNQRKSTVLDLARIHQGTGTGVVELLEAKAPAAEESPRLLHFKHLDDLPHFPRIYLPSQGFTRNKTRAGEWDRYLKRELPQLLSITKPSLVVVPPLLDICPFPKRTTETVLEGWKQSKQNALLKAVIAALEELRAANQSLHIVCFQDLSCTTRCNRHGVESESNPGPNGSASHRHPAGPCESNIDLAVLSYDTQTGMYALALVMVDAEYLKESGDVVEAGKEKDLERVMKLGTGATLLQLLEQIGTPEHHVGIKPKLAWVFPCLALPLCPVTGGWDKKEKQEQENIRKAWVDLIERTANSREASTFPDHSQIRPKLVTRSILESREQLRLFFEDMFLGATYDAVGAVRVDMCDEKERAEAEYSTLLAWCVAHCMGVVVQSHETGDQSLALLTLEQKKAYGQGCNSDPQLIVGGTGTGKTFLAVQKLIKCERVGLINDKRRGLFLTHEKNVALVKVVRAQLEMSGTKFVHIGQIPLGENLNTQHLWEMIKNAQKDGVGFVAVDGLEDFYLDVNYLSWSSLSARHLLSSLMEMKCFEMLWIIVNPFDMPKAHHQELCTYLMNPGKAGNTLMLDRRFSGNIPGLSVPINRMDIATWSSTLPVSLIPSAEHVDQGTQHGPLHKDYFSKGLFPYYGSLAGVVHDLLLGAHVPHKFILVVEATPEKSVEKQLQLDSCLIGEFGETGEPTNPSMAPLLVRAAWVGDIRDSLDVDELERVRNYLKGALLPADSTPAATTAVSVTCGFRELVKNHAVTGLWSGAPGELDVDSVAFQATLSLVNRFVTWSETMADDSSRPLQVLEEVLLNNETAGSTSKAPQLRDLIELHQCISLLNRCAVRGYEADVVVVWGPTFIRWKQPDICVEALARAKVQAFLVLGRGHDESEIEASFEEPIMEASIPQIEQRPRGSLDFEDAVRSRITGSRRQSEAPMAAMTTTVVAAAGALLDEAVAMKDAGLAGGSPSRVTAVARKFEDELDAWEFDTFRRAAKCVRSELSDDRFEDCGSLTEYWLFARHKKSGLPLLAHVGYRKEGCWDYLRDGKGELRRFITHDAMQSLIDIVCVYLEEQRGLNSCFAFPATAFFVLTWLNYSMVYTTLSCIELALKRCGKLLTPADTPDHYGESQLAAMLDSMAPFAQSLPTHPVQGSVSSQLLEAFLAHVPRGARDAVNMPSPSDGGTPAHQAVKLDLPADVLQVLIDHRADLTIKDGKGRTVPDLARIHHGINSDSDIVKFLFKTQQNPAAAADNENAAAGPQPLHFQPLGDLPHFPRIYLPSRPDFSKSSRTNEFIVEYLTRELPQLISIDDPSFLVVPPLEDTGDICPFPEYEMPTVAKGWKTERKALRAIVTALKELHTEGNQNLQIACFHDLRYGCHLPNGQGPWESDIDIAVLWRDSRTGVYALVLIEVKSITRDKDIVARKKQDGSNAGTLGTHALDQLDKHVQTLKHHVGIEPSPELVYPCLALPLYSTKVGPKGEKDEGDMQKRWLAFIEERPAQCCCPIRPRLLTKSTMETPDKLRAFFQDMFEITSNAATASSVTSFSNVTERREAEYSTVLAWCVAHCMGVAVHHASQTIDKHSAQVVEEALAQTIKPGMENDKNEAEVLALLTMEQKKAYDRGCNSVPQLIVGGAGTGKTLLAVQKLIRCERDGLINKKRWGLFLTHKKNVGLLVLVKKQLETSSTKYIDVMTVGGGVGTTSFTEVLASLQRGAATTGLIVPSKYCYVALDQLEDMFESTRNPQSVEKLMQDLMEVKLFEMFWITLNPFDVPARLVYSCALYLNSQENADHCIHLGTRVRNTQEISRVIDNGSISDMEKQFFTLLRRFQPEHMSSISYGCAAQQGVPVFYTSSPLFSNVGEGLADVLAYLLLEAAVKDKHPPARQLSEQSSNSGDFPPDAAHSRSHQLASCLALCSTSMLVIHIKEGSLPASYERDLLKVTDQHLIRKFCRTAARAHKNGKPPSTAPLLVEAAWAGGMNEAHLKDAELNRLGEEFRRYSSQTLSTGKSGNSSTTCSPADSSENDVVLVNKLIQFFHLQECMKSGSESEEGKTSSDYFSSLDAIGIDDASIPPALPAELVDSVAFQATLSLARRFTIWTAEMGYKDREHLGQLCQALHNGDADRLRNLILRHRCISILNADNVRGYEADVVIVWGVQPLLANPEYFVFPCSMIARMISRAKVMAVVGIWDVTEKDILFAFPSLKQLIERSD